MVFVEIKGTPMSGGEVAPGAAGHVRVAKGVVKVVAEDSTDLVASCRPTGGCVQAIQRRQDPLVVLKACKAYENGSMTQVKVDC